MAKDDIVQRLKRVQAKLAKIYAETVALRVDAEASAARRHLNDWRERRRVSRRTEGYAVTQPDRFSKA